MADWFSVLRPALYRLPPEAAHRLALWALVRCLWPPVKATLIPALEVRALGLYFPSPIGLAAGFDKNAIAINALLGQGFGFVETGTVTPRPQPGNSRPRLFRLGCDEAIINRLGFNNDGLEVFIKNFNRRDKNSGIAGINIGKNKNSSATVADYITGLQVVYPYADYVTVNISSPNTAGLRDLQRGEALTQLLSALIQARAECVLTYNRHVPLLLKVAPDLNDEEKEAIAHSALAAGIDGLVIGNTTLSRPPSLKSRHAGESGGLSGRPLFARSTEVLQDFYRLTGGKIVLVGAGGIFSADDAYKKIRAGATLLQLYTAIIYRGFSVVRNLQEGLATLLEKDGFTNIRQAVGADVRTQPSCGSGGVNHRHHTSDEQD
ncbi:MAG: quinone-dependent dihydroorotate dehydrogenase [Pseudomonadota bacterium]|nr:quinone-dependent dihydroorotate dehydrogenase [Pseudomonadota bacterium]